MDLATVQALVLSSTWPLPLVRFWTDPSLVFANMALTISQHIGLHRPGFHEEYARAGTEVRELDILERTRTWVACVIMSQKLSAESGHMPGMLFDCIINQACQIDASFDLPTELRQNLVIQRCSNKAFLTLSMNHDDPLGLPPDYQRYAIMAGLEHDFDVVADELGPNLSIMNNFRLRAARMYLQGMYFLDGTMSELRKLGILRAYSTASSLISNLISEDSSHDLLSHAPLDTFHAILCAAHITWKVLNSSYGNEVDHGAGNVIFNAASFAIRQVSVQHNEKDIPLRIADGLSMLRRYGESNQSLKGYEPTLRVKSRMGSNLIYDFILILRDCKRSQDESVSSRNKNDISNSTYVAYNQAPVSNAPAASTSVSQLTTPATMGIESWEAMPDMNWIWDYGYPSMYEI